MKVLLSTLVAASLSAAVAAWTAPGPSRIHVVTIDKHFHPDRLEIKIGDTVIWRNFDSASHTVTADTRPLVPQEDEQFDSWEIPTGGSYQHTFYRTGTFLYYCRLNPGMTGQVVVSR